MPLRRAIVSGKWIAVAMLVSASAKIHADEPASSRPKARAIEEVIVTSQKREESLQDVPVSVAVISADDIEERGLETLEDMTKAVPNVSINSTNLITQYYIRGIGSSSEGTFPQSVVVVLDGVPTSNNAAVTGMFLDMERIEVLRGPQGTLFGKNSVAGVINITTAMPTYEWEGKLNLQAGDLSSKRAEAMLNIPVWENHVALRLIAGKTSRDGYMYNTFQREEDGDFKTESLFGKLLIDITDNLSVRISGGNIDTKYPTGYGYQAIKYPDDMKFLAENADPEFEDNTDYQSSKNLNEYTAYNADVLNAVVEYNFKDYTISLITGRDETETYIYYDADFSPVDLIKYSIFDTGPNYNTFAELKVVSPYDLLNGRLDFITGIYRGYERRDFSVPLTIGNVNCSYFPDLCLPGVGGISLPAETLEIDTKSGQLNTGVYGQFTITLTEKMQAIFGLRKSVVESEAIDIENRTYTGVLPTPGPLMLAADYGNRQGNNDERTDESIDYKVSLRYYYSDEIMAYATVATGFKAGGYATKVLADNSVDSYEPEESITYELGVKGTYFDGLLRVNATAFATKYDKLQIMTHDGFGPVTSNAGTALTKGLELETQAVLPAGLFIGFNASYLDAAYQDYKKAICHTGDTQDVQDDGDPFTTDPCDYSGERMAYAPDYSASILLSGEWQLWDFPVLFNAGLDVSWQDDILYQSDTDPIDSQEAYAVTNFRLGFRGLDDWWRITAFVDNAFDKTYLTYSNDMPVIEGAHWGSVASPRLYSVALSMKF